MDVKPVLRSQYLAALEMLADAILKCPDALWDDPSAKNRFWHIAYHTLFYTHLYLSGSEADFTAWPQHRKDHQFLGELPWPPHEKPEIGAPYRPEELMTYLRFCQGFVDERLLATDLDAASGFSWIPFGKLELQLYNIRHIQHHTGQLADRLRIGAGASVRWIGLAPVTA